ncbi:uncharacterized protein [Pagrus major]|uniref:uncharacterized protein n=1 Tax=Pagrus major TaxID=143350 RepID=UPI003CC8533D
MEDFHISSTSQDKSFNYSNITSNYNDSSNIINSDPDELHGKVKLILYVMTCVITAIGLPLTLVAIYAVYSLVRKDHVVPVYVINLLISDLIQFCCLITSVTGSDGMMSLIVVHIYFSSLMVSVCFMLCIALERYLIIACPLWYRFRHTIKFSVVLCVVVWVLSPVTSLTLVTLENVSIARIVIGTFFFFPLPLFIFFLGGTLKALSASRVPSDEKRRILGILVLVLLIYTLLFLPAIILLMGNVYNHHLAYVSYVFLWLSPLADLFLYVFMRKGIIDKLLASVCCCRMDSNDSSRMDSNDITSSTIHQRALPACLESLQLQQQSSTHPALLNQPVSLWEYDLTLHSVHSLYND